MRALAVVLNALLKAYQRWISPMMPSRCRFYPSCSQYAIEAIRMHGPFAGMWLGARRVLRCHPWNPGGLDLVPRAIRTERRA